MKYHVKRMKQQITPWEKILANCISKKELISRIYEEFSILNVKTQTIQLKDLNRHFTKQAVQTAEKHMKRCSVSQTSGDMYITSPIRHH